MGLIKIRQMRDHQQPGKGDRHINAQLTADRPVRRERLQQIVGLGEQRFAATIKLFPLRRKIQTPGGALQQPDPALLLQLLQCFGHRRSVDLQIFRRLGKAAGIDDFNKNFNIFKQIHLHDDPPPTSSSVHIITNLITVMKVFAHFLKQ